jgi:TolB-like protein
MFLLRIILTAILIFSLNCCAKKRVSPEMPLIKQTSIFQLTDIMAAELIKNARDGGLNISDSIITTFVNMDDLQSSSKFGRILSEGIGNGLFRRGINIVEIKTSDAISAQPRTGEIILSRDPAELDSLAGAKYVITGVYTVGLKSVSISSRIIELPNKKVISVASNEIIKTEDIEELLKNNDNSEVIRKDKPTSYDKMPQNY